MGTRKLVRAMAVPGLVISVMAAAIPAGAVGIKPAVVQPSTTSKATASKPVNVKVDAAAHASQTPTELAKSTWGIPSPANYYGLPTSDAQRKFK